MKNEYDVVVVGAGPAGLSSAKTAAENGASVLLLEEHPAIGVPVQCGESLIVSGMDDLGMEREDTWFTYYGIRKLKAFSPNGVMAQVIVPPEEGQFVVMLDRKVFEKKLAVLVAQTGAEVQTKCRATGVLKDGDKVVGVRLSRFGVEHEIACKVLIAADGPQSNVARWAGLKVLDKVADFDSCAQYQMANVKFEEDAAELYFGEMAPGAGLWILPKGNGLVNVGLGILGGDSRTAMEYLDDFVNKDERFKDASIIEVNVGPVPVAGTIPKMYGNGILVVGDAAGQVNPFTGGGMKFAINAGIKAGELAAKSVKAKDTSSQALEAYQTWWDKDFGRRFRGFLVFKDIFLTSNTDDLDSIFKDIGTVELKGFDKKLDIAYLAMKRLLPILLKRPKLVWKLRKISKWLS